MCLLEVWEEIIHQSVGCTSHLSGWPSGSRVLKWLIHFLEFSSGPWKAEKWFILKSLFTETLDLTQTWFFTPIGALSSAHWTMRWGQQRIEWIVCLLDGLLSACVLGKDSGPQKNAPRCIISECVYVGEALRAFSTQWKGKRPIVILVHLLYEWVCEPQLVPSQTLLLG